MRYAGVAATPARLGEDEFLPPTEQLGSNLFVDDEMLTALIE